MVLGADRGPVTGGRGLERCFDLGLSVSKPCSHNGLDWTLLVDTQTGEVVSPHFNVGDRVEACTLKYILETQKLASALN